MQTFKHLKNKKMNFPKLTTILMRLARSLMNQTNQIFSSVDVAQTYPRMVKTNLLIKCLLNAKIHGSAES